MFKKITAIFGGGASVDTVLAVSQTQPGGVLDGEVRLCGGSVELTVDRIELELVANVEGGAESDPMDAFQRLHLGHRFALEPGSVHAIPFQLVVPWETPVTLLNGSPLAGTRLGVRTAVELAAAFDKGDLDPIGVNPLPAQARLLDAFGRLGFRFKGADLIRGSLHRSRLPFFQEFVFHPASQYPGAVNELGVTFLCGADSMDVLVEVDQRGGFLAAGQDAYNRFTVQYAGAEQRNWEQWLHEHLEAIPQRRGLFH